MSLLEEAYEKFVILNMIQQPDGYGGIQTSWVEGGTIEGAMVLDSSNQAKIAQAMGVTSIYTLTVKQGIQLNYRTVLKRLSDSKIFRLTNDSDDKKTPRSAGLDMRQYSAEEFTLPRGD